MIEKGMMIYRTEELHEMNHTPTVQIPINVFAIDGYGVDNSVIRGDLKFDGWSDEDLQIALSCSYNVRFKNEKFINQLKSSNVYLAKFIEMLEEECDRRESNEFDKQPKDADQ